MKKLALEIAAVAAGAALVGRALVRCRRRFDLTGKNVLITGGSRGLGLILAQQLLQRGARVAVCARDPEGLDRAKEQLSRNGRSITAVACDLTDQAQVGQMVGLVRQANGPIDVLINNAGAITVGPLQKMSAEDFDAAMRTHFYGALYTTLAVLPDMRAKRAGRIVNISSIGGLMPVPHLAPYTASKFALTGLSQALRVELLRQNIYVTTIYPGLMRTGSPRNATVKGKHKIEYAMFKLMDSLPPLAMSAQRAARQIIKAFTHGQANLVLGLPARKLACLHANFPSLSNDLSGNLNRLLPIGKSDDLRAMTGDQAESWLSRSPLAMLTHRAAKANNQI